MKPQCNDAVLGGTQPSPAPGALVLGTGKLYGRLFDRFNSEAQLCNKNYLRFELTPALALIRKRRAPELADIKIKIWLFQSDKFQNLQQKGEIAIFQYTYWIFGGYLKHDGLLFGHTAKYDPADCDLELRPIVAQALREAAR